MENKNEIFFYLGRLSQKVGALHIFFHTLKYTKDHTISSIERASAELYNVMINETMIKKGDSVFVFNIIPDFANISCVQITHETFQQIIQQNDIQDIWSRILVAKREPPYLIISMDFKPNADVEKCSSYVVDNMPELSNILNDMSKQKNVNFLPITKFISKKSI